MQACARPSESSLPSFVLPATTLGDINIVMDEIRAQMATELSAECVRQGGAWNDTPCKGTGCGNNLLTIFYTNTNSNTQWGQCTGTTQTAAMTSACPNNSEPNPNCTSKVLSPCVTPYCSCVAGTMPSGGGCI